MCKRFACIVCASEKKRGNHIFLHIEDDFAQHKLPFIHWISYVYIIIHTFELHDLNIYHFANKYVMFALNLLHEWNTVNLNLTHIKKNQAYSLFLPHSLDLRCCCHFIFATDFRIIVRAVLNSHIVQCKKRLEDAHLDGSRNV